MLQEKLNGKSNVERRSWERGPPFCYCFWQLQLLRALPPNPGTKIIARASCSSEPETAHVNLSVQNFFSEGSSEKKVEPRGRRYWRTWCSPHCGPRRRRPRRGWSRGREGYWSCWVPRAMARPSTAPSMRLRSTWPRRTGRATRGRRGLSHGGGSGGGEGLGSRDRERRETRLRVLAGPRGPPHSSAG
jgi:hypothetical protein